MAKFKFALEAVLKLRAREEELARLAYIEAQRAVEAQNQKIQSMYQRADEVRDEISSGERAGTPHAMEIIRASETFLHGHRLRIDEARREAGRLLEILEDKHEAMTLAAREHKILEKLREKRRQEFIAALDKREAEELDDLATIRRSREKR